MNDSGSFVNIIQDSEAADAKFPNGRHMFKLRDQSIKPLAAASGADSLMTQMLFYASMMRR